MVVWYLWRPLFAFRRCDRVFCSEGRLSGFCRAFLVAVHSTCCHAPRLCMPCCAFSLDILCPFWGFLRSQSFWSCCTPPECFGFGVGMTDRMEKRFGAFSLLWRCHVLVRVADSVPPISVRPFCIGLIAVLYFGDCYSAGVKLLWVILAEKRSRASWQKFVGGFRSMLAAVNDASLSSILDRILLVLTLFDSSAYALASKLKKLLATV